MVAKMERDVKLWMGKLASTQSILNLLRTLEHEKLGTADMEHMINSHNHKKKQPNGDTRGRDRLIEEMLREKKADANREEKNCRVQYSNSLTKLKGELGNTPDYRSFIRKMQRYGARIRCKEDRKHSAKIKHLRSKFRDEQADTLHPALTRYNTLEIFSGCKEQLDESEGDGERKRFAAAAHKEQDTADTGKSIIYLSNDKNNEKKVRGGFNYLTEAHQKKKKS